MGWCSGSSIFNDVVESVLASDADEETKTNIIVATINALESHDWDCQDEVVADDPVVINAFLVVHPDWEWLKERQRESLVTRCSNFVEGLPNNQQSSSARYNEATKLLADMVTAFKGEI